MILNVKKPNLSRLKVPERKTVIRGIIYLILVITYIIFLIYFNNVNKTKIVDYSGRSYVRARVTNIERDNLNIDGSRGGSQMLSVEILEGKEKGNTFQASNTSSDHIGIICKVGMEVVVDISSSDLGSVVTVFSPNRQMILYAIIIIFILVLWIIGGKKGIRSSIALVFTFVTILFLYLPLIYRGFSPIIGALLVAIFTTVVSLCIIGSLTVKTLIAIFGTIFGIIMAGIFATIFGKMTSISGYSVSDYETLLFIGQSTNIKIGELLFAGIIFSSLGAVMDITYSMASTIEEVSSLNKDMNKNKLFLSGIKVGRDMIGTMCNTLILAFAGGMLTMLVSIYAYNQPFAQTINSSEIAIDVIESIAGSLGMILAVPFVAYLASRLIPYKKIRNKQKA